MINWNDHCFDDCKKKRLVLSRDSHLENFKHQTFYDGSNLAAIFTTFA